MNLTFEITSKFEAEERLQKKETPFPNHLISIRAPGNRPLMGMSCFRGEVLELVFCDITFHRPKDTWAEERLGYRPVWESVPPNRRHVQKIVEFGKCIPPKGAHLLVHCQAGISRSTAATIIVMATTTSPSKAAAQNFKKLVYEARPQARPNNLMLELADELLGWDGHLAALGGWNDEISAYRETTVVR